METRQFDRFRKLTDLYMAGVDPAAGAEFRIVDFRLRHYIIRPSPSKTSKYQFPYRRNVDYTLLIAVTPIFWAGADGAAGAVFRDTGLRSVVCGYTTEYVHR